MVESKHWASRLFVVLNYFILGFLALSCLIPLIHIFAISLSDSAAATGGLWMSGLAALGAWWGLVAVAVVVVGAGVSGPCIAFLFRLASDCRFWLLHISKPAAMKNIDTIISSISRSLNKYYL